MPAISFGGAPISACDYTRSWGVSPASANIVCPGEVTAAVDDEVTINFGGATFYGRVGSIVEDRTNGLTTNIAVADNRLLLHREYVTCAFNQVEVIEDDVTTPGVDRKKRYWHILPDDWATNNKSYTDTPLTAGEILDHLRLAPTLTFTWVFTSHAGHSQPVFGIEAMNGKKLANVLSEISDKLGLVFTLSGANVIGWARKGEGTLPSIPSTAFDRRSGEAMSNNDTQIRLIGDRNRYQCDSVTLEPDWNAHYAAYWLEAAWVDRVDSLFGPYDNDAAGQATLFAKARSLTLREYVAETASTNADYGLWGEISRMELPVWVYLQDVVYKAYRVPRTFTLGDSDWNSIELVEGLLHEMDYDPSTGALTIKADGEDYPDTKALIIAQGQQVGVIDPKYQKALTPAQIASARDLWSVVPRFSLDTKNKVVIFEEAVIRPGTGSAALFKFPNVGVDGTHLASSHPAYNLAVPNAAVTITAAPVKATLVFEAERFYVDYGSGFQRGTHYARGLRRDVLLVDGVFNSELEYADAATAEEKADEVIEGVVARAASYASGGFKRRGTVGTALNGTIDRVTIRLGEFGLEEEVEYTKERSPNAYNHERDMDRKQRTKELFPGAEENKQEVWALQQLAKVSREMKRTFQPALRSVNDVMLTPVGAPHSGQQNIDDRESALGTVSGGQPIVTSKTTGKPIFSGATNAVFAGIAVSDGQTGQITVATQGTVPVRVKGPVEPGASVYWKSGQTYAEAAGDLLLGSVAAKYEGTATVLLPVRLGAGAGSALTPLSVIDASDEDGKKVRIVKGMVANKNDCFNSGDTPPYVLPVSDGDVIYAKLGVSYTDEDGWVATDLPEIVALSEPPSDTDPNYAYCELKDVAISGEDMALGGGVAGNVAWARYGNGTDFGDVWFKGP